MTLLPQISIDTERDIDMCFGCGKNNPIGLKLKFQRDGQIVKSEFTPTELHQGWADIVHGGIIHCILDEAMSYAAMFEGLYCVTAKMECKFKRPALIGEPLIITSSITRNARRFVETQASISLKDGTLVAEGKATMFIANRKQDSTSKQEDVPKNNA